MYKFKEIVEKIKKQAKIRITKKIKTEELTQVEIEELIKYYIWEDEEILEIEKQIEEKVNNNPDDFFDEVVTLRDEQHDAENELIEEFCKEGK